MDCSSSLRRSSSQEAENQICCSIEALNITHAVTLKDILHNYGPASVLIRHLKMKDKRSLRLVCHAGKDAVDKTVTFVYMPDIFYSFRSDPNAIDDGSDYARILSKSNWKDIKKLGYKPQQKINSGWYYEKRGFARIAKAGLSKLETLILVCCEINIDDAYELVKAGWKLTRLCMYLNNTSSEWLGPLVRDANWPLEELTIDICTDSIADLIVASDWKLKELNIRSSLETLSPEGVETLMRASWISTIETLDLTFKKDTEKKGVRAISHASHRASKLIWLAVTTSEFDDEDALILADGSYPNMKQLHTRVLLQGSVYAEIRRKCPELVLTYHLSRLDPAAGAPHVVDPETGYAEADIVFDIEEGLIVHRGY